MDSRKSKTKYEDMEPNANRKVTDVMKTAQKMAVKTQRALQGPLAHFTPQPKDEKLMEDDFGLNQSTNNAENGGFNDAFTTIPQFDEAPHTKRSQSELMHYESRRPPHGHPVKRTVTKRSGNPSDIPTVSAPYLYAPNGDVTNAEKRSNTSRQALHSSGDPAVDDIFPSHQRHTFNPWVNSDDKLSQKPDKRLTFQNIVYKVSTKKYPWSPEVKKTILDNVSGLMQTGLNAIMGPSGSGKSSILDVLAGRKDPQYLDGKVLIDGNPQPKDFKRMSGYVVQDDIVMGTLTVKENLMFSAALRLPADFDYDARSAKVQKIIEDLGLAEVANSKIGTELLRGVSGGERKRCNIGMELITDPAVLFLDEPTTGLDASTASKVIKILKRISRTKIIILSIHQPKYSIYQLFDRYTLMAKGKIIYHGPGGKDPSKYFRNLGYELETYNNPPDFYMDIIHGDVKSNRESKEQQGTETAYDHTDFRQVQLLNSVGKHKTDRKKETVRRLIAKWQESDDCKKLNRELNRYTHSQVSLNSSRSMETAKTTNWFNQLRWVCWRTALNLVRNPQTSVIQLGVYLFFAFSMGIVYFGLTTTNPRGYQDRYGLFYFSALQVIFVNLGAIEIFIKERPIFIHENSSGYYQVSSYFLAKLLCDMVPIKVIPAIVFLPITYFMAKLKSDVGAFFFFELILLLTTSAGCSIAFFVSSTFSVFGLANVVTPIIYVFMMVFSGFLISIDSIFVWLNWCRYLSAFRYAIAGLAINELNGTNFCQNVSVPCITGNNFLDLNAIPYSTAWDLWVNPVGLFIITIIFLGLCYVQLRRINKYR